MDRTRDLIARYDIKIHHFKISIVEGGGGWGHSIPVKTMSHAINKLPKKFLKHFSPFLRKDIACSHSP